MARSNLRSGRTSSATAADILVGEAISDENPSRLDSIDPANLFPRGDRAGIVTNGHLPDLVPQLANLRGYLGAELESLAPQRDLLQHARVKNLVANRFVRDVSPVE